MAAAKAMTSADIRETVLESLLGIAPEVDPARLDPAVSFRDQIDIDSVDYLNFVLALESALGIEIPGIDYPRLSSLDGCIAHLTGRMADFGNPSQEPD
jgi:acyl carrier protein